MCRMSIVKIAFLGTFLLLAPPCWGQVATVSGVAEAIERADVFVGELDEAGAPGCALGVLDLDTRSWVYQGAYGLADIEHDIANTPDLVFGVASVTKQFTAAAVALAAHQGYFSLGDDIRAYVPEIPDYGAPITIRDLIHHTNGLRDIGRLILLTGKMRRYLGQDSRVGLLARQRATNFPAGTDYRYGNSDYLLLAELIERTSGQAFADYVEENIFRPLGMKDSYFGTATRGKDGRALPYSYTQEKWRGEEWLPEAPGDWGPAGLMTRLDDFAKWTANLFADESRLAGGAELTRMLRANGRLRDGSPVPYGFGLRLLRYRGLKTIGHSGSGYGYKAHTVIFPDRALGVFGFCNNGIYAQPVVMGLADIFLDLASDGQADPKEPAITLSPAQLKDFTGVYRENELRLPMIVESRGNGLLVTGDASPSIFEPVAMSRFRNKQNLIIEFEGRSEAGARFFIQKQGRKYGSGRFERVERLSLAKRRIAEYAGDYYSPEVDATYRFSVEGGKLMARILEKEPRSISPFTFEPLIEDEFVAIPDRLAIRFTRERGGAPTGLVLTYQFGWITDVEFYRVQP